MRRCGGPALLCAGAMARSIALRGKHRHIGSAPKMVGAAQ